jgi:hypothetical protein
VTLRFPSPWMIARLSDAGLRERLSDARTLLMYGHNARIRQEAMRAIEDLNAELERRGGKA